MKRYELFYLAVLFLLLLRWAAGLCGAPCFGFNHLHYLDAMSGAAWSVAGILLLLLPLTRKRFFEELLKPAPAMPGWAAAAAFLVTVLALSKVATPLLGDGVDRVEATIAGFRALKGQPAPLDLVVHLLAYKLPVWTGESAWERSLQSWQAVSIAGGVAACFFCWKLAAWRAPNTLERWFIFFTLFGAGTVVFFLGYAENYSLPAAGLYGFLLLLEAVRYEKAPAWTLYPALAALTALHYFFALLIPPALYIMYRHGHIKPGRLPAALIVGVLLAFAGFALFMVEEHYRGVAAILVSSDNILSPYHLLGFLNQQILACPALPLLLPPALLSGRSSQDPLQSFALAGAVIFTVFFFFLRPVIGPAADWDLFAVPALLYTPWMALRLHAAFRGKASFPYMAWSTIVLVLVSTGPWISVNSREESSIQRYKDIMELESRHNTWAASYGYYRLARYFVNEGGPYHKIDNALRQAIRTNPDSATLRLQTARLYNLIGSKDIAEKHLFYHYKILGLRLKKDRKPRQAARSLEKALQYAEEEQKPKLWKALLSLYDGPLDNSEKAGHFRDKIEKKRKNNRR